MTGAYRFSAEGKDARPGRGRGACPRASLPRAGAAGLWRKGRVAAGFPLPREAACADAAALGELNLRKPEHAAGLEKVLADLPLEMLR